MENVQISCLLYLLLVSTTHTYVHHRRHVDPIIFVFRRLIYVFSWWTTRKMLFISDCRASFFLLFVDLFPLSCWNFANFISQRVCGENTKSRDFQYAMRFYYWCCLGEQFVGNKSLIQVASAILRLLINSFTLRASIARKNNTELYRINKGKTQIEVAVYRSRREVYQQQANRKFHIRQRYSLD